MFKEKILSDVVREILINEAFEFAGKRGEAAYSQNWKQAKVFVKDKDYVRDFVNKVKKSQTSAISPKDLNNNLTAIHIIRKIAGSAKYKQRHEEAIALLKNIGIDITSESSRKNNIKVLQSAKKSFFEQVKRANPGETKEAPTASVEKPAEISPEKPIETPSQEPEAEPTERKEVPARQIPREIEKLKNDSLKLIAQKYNIPIQNLERILGEAEEEKTKNLTKSQTAGLRNILKSFNKKMDKLSRSASQMPSTAQEQLIRARSEAFNIQMKALGKMTPGRLSVLGKRVAETGQGAIRKTAETYKRTKEKIEKSPSAQAFKSKFDKTTEKIAAKWKAAEEAQSAKKKERKEQIPLKSSGTALERAKETFRKVRSKFKKPSKEELQKRFIKKKTTQETGKIRKAQY